MSRTYTIGVMAKRFDRGWRGGRWTAVAAIVGCSHPAVTAVHIDAVRGTTAAPRAAEIEPSDACPIAPMKLSIATPQGRLTVMTLARSGSVEMALAGPVGRLDSRGCFVAAANASVEAEIFPGGVWTRLDRFEVAHDALHLANGRTMRVRSDGALEFFGEDGKLDAYDAGFVVEGYGHDAEHGGLGRARARDPATGGWNLPRDEMTHVHFPISSFRIAGGSPR
jgi:hypothetical protein